MYDNVGQKIKGLVSAVVKLMIFFSILFGIIVIIASFATEIYIGVFAGLAIAILGSLSAWMSGLILYAYGEITQCVQKMAGVLQTDTVDNANSSLEESNVAEKDPWEEGSWVCSECGTENPLLRKYCLKCNTSKEWSDTKK